QPVIADPAGREFGTGLRQAGEDILLIRLLGISTAQPVEQLAENGFAVGAADGLERPRAGGEVIDLAIMGKGPVLPPQLTGKRVGIGQTDPPDVVLANVTDDILRLDRVALDQLCDGGAVAGRRVMEAAYALALIEGHTPAVAVGSGAAATLHQPGKAETDIRRYVGTHAHQFTHLVSLYYPTAASHSG